VARIVALLTLLGIGVGLSAKASNSQDTSSQLIESDFVVPDVLGKCDAATAAGIIAMAVGVPAGIEHVPGLCDYRNDDQTSGSGKSLRGWSIREAFDHVVHADPRYRWTASDGVLSFRPIAAVALADHFLITATGALELADADMGASLSGVTGILGARYSFPPTTRTPQAAHRITVSIPTITALGALDEVVRRHGRCGGSFVTVGHSCRAATPR
jgi:hypothetical protein